MKKGLPRWASAAFLVVFLLLGLVTAGDYGSPWDEQDEMDILRMNLWEYARAFKMDESAFEKRAAQFDPQLTINPLSPISESVEQDHGVCMFYPLAGVVMDESLTEAQRSEIWHMWCWAVFTLGAAALYATLRQLGLGRGMALLGPLCLLLTPQFFAHGHYNNKDIALFSLALCMLWQALRLMKKPTFSTGLLFGAFGALATNTKLAGLALWGLCALAVLIRQILARNLKPRVWAAAAAAVGAFCALYILVTPALWADPMGFVQYGIINALSFQRWKNILLFRGTVFRLGSQKLPFYYLPYMILATTPLWLLALIGAGSLLALGKALRPERERRWMDSGLPLLLTGLMWVLPLGAAVVTRTNVYNGWRHFYFVYGPMLVLAVWGVDQLRKRLQKPVLRRAGAGVLAACMAVSGVGIAMEHPYQYAYYQPLVQLQGTDYNELDYWNLSVREALTALAEQTEGEIVIEPGDRTVGYGLDKALYAMEPELRARFRRPDEREEAQYVLVNPLYAVFSEFEYTADLRECITLTSYGQPIMRIYERRAEDEYQ